MKFDRFPNQLLISLVLLFVVFWLSLSFTEKSINFWKEHIDPNSSKIEHVVKTPLVSERLNTEDMFYLCRATATVLVEDSVSRALSIPYNEFGPHYQSMQIVGQAFDAYHKCEVLLAATFVNDENRQKINPTY